MKPFISLLKLSFLPQSADLALLFLRVVTAGSMFWLHGLKKITQFGSMSESFPDPFGISSTGSLLMAILGEVVGSFLLALGLFSRLAALMGASTMVVALVFVKAEGNEIALLYLWAYVTLLLAGPGRFSLDANLK